MKVISEITETDTPETIRLFGKLAQVEPLGPGTPWELS